MVKKSKKEERQYIEGVVETPYANSFLQHERMKFFVVMPCGHDSFI